MDEAASRGAGSMMVEEYEADFGGEQPAGGAPTGGSLECGGELDEARSQLVHGAMDVAAEAMEDDSAWSVAGRLLSVVEEEEGSEEQQAPSVELVDNVSVSTRSAGYGAASEDRHDSAREFVDGILSSVEHELSALSGEDESPELREQDSPRERCTSSDSVDGPWSAPIVIHAGSTLLGLPHSESAETGVGSRSHGDAEGYSGDVSWNYGKSNLTLQEWETQEFAQEGPAHDLSAEISSADEFVDEILSLVEREHSEMLGQGDLPELPFKTSRPSTSRSQLSRPATTFIEEELKEVLEARKNRISYHSPLRPPTNYIAEEVREVLAARSQMHRITAHEQPQDRMNAQKASKSPLRRNAQRPEDRAKWRRDARILRRDIASLDKSKTERENAMRAKRNAAARKSQDRLTLDSPASTLFADVSFDDGQVASPDHDALPRFLPNTATGSQASSPISQPSSPALWNNAERTQAVLSTDAEIPISPALGSSTAQDGVGPSTRLLQNTPLSVVNKYWYKTRDMDNLRLLLMDEQQMVEKVIQASDKRLSRKRLEQQRESARTADEIHQSALKISKNADKAEQFREEASVVVAVLKEELEQAREEAKTARQHFFAYHEVMKWKDSLTPAEETDLAARRYRMSCAEEAVTETQAQYDKQFEEAFIRAAKNYVAMTRRQRLESSMRPADLHTLRAVEVGRLHAQDDDNPQTECLMTCNRLFAAVSHYVRQAGLQYIPTMYLMHVRLQQLSTADQTACMNIMGQAQYAGNWVGGKAHGMGVEMLHSTLGLGNRYEGQMADDVRHGLGALIMRETGVVYEGMWWWGKRHGFGVESHLLKGVLDPLPVAYVQYEDGNRVSTARFDLQSDTHLYMLESVRQIRSSARELARQARKTDLFESVINIQKRVATRKHPQIGFSDTTNDDEGGYECENEDGTGTEQRLQREYMERRRRKILEKRKKQDAKQSQKDLGVVHERHELDKIDLQVDSAMKDLKSSTVKAFGDLDVMMKSVGMKTGRLYGQTEEEMRVAGPPKAPTRSALIDYLMKQGVAEELAGRMADIWVETQGPGATRVKQAQAEYERMKLSALVDLASGSDWHGQDKQGRVVIRKRFSGTRQYTKPEGEAAKDRDRRVKVGEWEHMPAIPGMDAVLKLMPAIRGAVVPARVESSPDARPARVAGGRGAKTRIKSFGQAAKEAIKTSSTALATSTAKLEAPLRIITVPMDMPFELAIGAFDASEHAHILLLPGVYKIKGRLQLDKSIRILGEDGARILGRLKLQGDGCESWFKNVHLEYHANERSTDFERMIHIDRGELLLQDCALLCPGGYGLWADGRSVVNVCGCVLAGSVDGAIASQATAVCLNFSRCTIRDSRLENCKESCVFIDHDAHVKLSRCVLHSADAGLMLNDRAFVEVSGSDIRLMQRGAIGQMKNATDDYETCLVLRGSQIHGHKWAFPAQPAKLVEMDNSYFESPLPPLEADTAHSP